MRWEKEGFRVKNNSFKLAKISLHTLDNNLHNPLLQINLCSILGAKLFNLNFKILNLNCNINCVAQKEPNKVFVKWYPNSSLSVIYYISQNICRVYKVFYLRVQYTFHTKTQYFSFLPFSSVFFLTIF